MRLELNGAGTEWGLELNGVSCLIGGYRPFHLELSFHGSLLFIHFRVRDSVPFTLFLFPCMYERGILHLLLSFVYIDITNGFIDNRFSVSMYVT